MRPFILLLTALLSLCGCATILSNGTDRVTITTDGMPETRIYVDELLVGWQQAEVSLARGQVHLIRVERDGCVATEVETALEFDPSTWGGVSTLGLGMAADVATGNAWRVDQSHYTLIPDCSTALLAPGEEPVSGTPILN